MTRRAALPLSVAGVAALSLLLPAAPDYDALAWLTWGRELTHLELSTQDGPAFKPLPVAVCALLTPLGSAAPGLWLLVARTGAVAAVVLAALLAADLAGRGGPRARWVAGLAAGAAVLLTGGFVRRALGGDAEPLLVALALGALHRHRAGHPGQALWLASAACLVRVEAWPFALAYAGWLAWRSPRLRAPVVLGAVAVPVLWFVPELLGSGDLLRSGDRARIPNPGQPATADVPALASLELAVRLLPLPLAAAVLAVRGRAAALPALAGLAWVLLVAAMAQAGFSGEGRYLMPGIAVIGVSAGAGLARLGRAALPAGVALTVVTAALAVAPTRDALERSRHQEALDRDLRAVIAAVGGRDALLACGRPAVGRFRGTLAAYRLDVSKRDVRADGRPDAVTLRSPLTPGAPVEPAAPAGGRVLARQGLWTVVVTRC